MPIGSYFNDCWHPTTTQNIASTALAALCNRAGGKFVLWVQHGAHSRRRRDESAAVAALEFAGLTFAACSATAGWGHLKLTDCCTPCVTWMYVERALGALIVALSYINHVTDTQRPGRL